MVVQITIEDVKTRLEPLNLSHCDIIDITANMCSTAFECVFVGECFKGKRLLKRHQMVNDLLKDIMPDIHAFTQKTLTEEEWQKQKEKEQQ